MKYCSKCGAEIQDQSNFCQKCGASTVVPTGNMDLPDTFNADYKQKHYVDDLSFYYQGEFEKISNSNEAYKGKWNWAAFWFGGIWALTKGLWLSAIIAIVGGLFTSGIIGIIYWFVFAIRGNYMFYQLRTKKQQLPF